MNYSFRNCPQPENLEARAAHLRDHPTLVPTYHLRVFLRDASARELHSVVVLATQDFHEFMWLVEYHGILMCGPIYIPKDNIAVVVAEPLPAVPDGDSNVVQFSTTTPAQGSA